MNYVYHFCVSSQAYSGRISLYSGVAVYNGRVDTLERYNMLREDIAQQSGFSLDNMAVNSLSFLHEVEVVDGQAES